MKLIIVAAAMVALANANGLNRVSEREIDAQFEQFKFTHNKQYASAMEETFRKTIFAQNLNFILSHNDAFQAGRHSYFLGVNQFADLPVAEFKAKHLTTVRRVQHSKANVTVAFEVRDLPDSIDWTTKGVVAPVKNQGQCGNVVAFASVATIESAHAIKTGQLVPLSEAQIEDCCASNGCNGSPMTDDDAFQCVINQGGLDTEASYPAPEQSCHFNPNTVGATISSFVDVSSGSEASLKSAVALSGPVAAEINAGLASFMLYAGGVYNDPQCTSDSIDHAVAVVGYGTDSAQNQEFWKAKNSWGTSWGEQGYIRMARDQANQCGIASKASYPVV